MEEVKAIDILYHLFTPEAVQKNYYEQPEFQRILKWWGVEKKSYTPEEWDSIADGLKGGLYTRNGASIVFPQAVYLLYVMNAMDVAHERGVEVNLP